MTSAEVQRLALAMDATSDRLAQLGERIARLEVRLAKLGKEFELESSWGDLRTEEIWDELEAKVDR